MHIHMHICVNMLAMFIHEHDKITVVKYPLSIFLYATIKKSGEF